MNTANISHLINLKGFTIEGREEQIKEIAIANIACRNIALYRFLLPIPYSSMSFKEKQSVLLGTRQYHGITYKNSRHDLPPQYIPHFISKITSDCKKSNSITAYSGGTAEKALLGKNGAHQIISLENLCCPSFHTLFCKELYREIARKFRIQLSENTHIFCHHRRLQTGAPAPCALIEAMYSGAWLILTYNPFDTNKENTNQP